MTASFSFKEIAWKRILFVMVLIFVPNLLIMRGEIAGPVNDLLGLATAIDLVIVLPLALYFFSLRKRAPLFALFIFMFWGLLLANWIIPNKANGYLSYYNYSIITIEALFITIEIFILVTILRKLPSFIRNFKEEQNVHYHFLFSFSKAIQMTISNENKQLKRFQILFPILATDIAAIYYSLFTWRKKPPFLDNEEAKTFTFHKDGAYLGVFSC